ncbi:MAG: type II secretion protein ATPase [Alphaproteobacteria bacterium]|nr:type II secretion protein ATPase [Alphaproteobacteria bacterium]
MSDAANQNTSILLPTAAVAVYSRDRETLEAARALSDDWRFARVAINVQEGDATSAAQDFRQGASPDLVLVQTETIDDSFPAQLEVLAGSCDENTAAIVIGPVNDVYLYRKLIDMGVSDYLVRPIPVAVMAEVIARTLIERKGVAGSRLIAFAGAKGGVGATALAQAAAWTSAEILGQKTLLLDTAGGWSTFSVGLGFEPAATLSAAARAAANNDEESLKRMLFRADDKLSVLATGSEALLSPGIEDSQVEELINVLMVKYPVVIVDLSHASPEVHKTVLRRANQVNIVTTPFLPALRHARTLVHEIQELRGGKDEKTGSGIELIINMQGMATAHEVSRKDIEQAMELKISATVPFAPRAFIGSESESKRLTLDKDGQGIVRGALLPVLRRAIGGDAEEQEAPASGGFFSNILGKLKGGR